MSRLRNSFLALFLSLGASSLARAAVPGSTAPPEIERLWFALTATLEPFDSAALREKTEELLRTAASLELQRLTPFAQTLTLKARTLPAEAKGVVLRQALRLDPGCPEALFELASLQLGQLQPGGILTAARAFLAFLRDGRLVRFREASVLLLLLLAGGGLALAWSLVQTLRTLPRLWHDLMELASAWRLGANVWVFAAFLTGLPLFLALDPVWLGFWVFALSWGYWNGGVKALGLVVLAFAAAAPTLLEVAHRNFTHPVDPLTRAALALAEHRYDPLALVELDGVSDLFAEEPGFYRLKGDLERQFGLLDASIASYQAGLRLASADPALLLSAGCAHYLQGNYGAAVQLFTQSRDRGYDPVIVHYNLSLAFSHVYNFREAEEAIAAARRASEARLSKLTRGRDNQLILPRFTVEEARQLLASKNRLVLLNRGLVPPPLARQRTLLAPVTLAATFSLLLALGHFLFREKKLGFAKACSKCGRTFCSRCKLSRESQSYCTQCINIFLKRDMVAPELQIAKHRQLARRAKLLGASRRLLDTLLPGLGLAFSGRPVLGTALALPAAVLAVVALLWLPGWVAPLLLSGSFLPVQAAAGALWAAALVAAQVQKAGEG